MITQNVTLSLSEDSLLRRRYPLKTPAWEAIQKVDQNFNPGLVQEPITYRHLISAYQPFRTLILPQPSLSIRRFWGKGEKWKRKRKRGEGKKRLTQMLLLEPSTLTQHDSIPSNQNHFRSLGCQLHVSKSSPEINLN